MTMQGSTLTVNRWPMASKKFTNWLRTSKVRPQLVLHGQWKFEDILVVSMLEHVSIQECPQTWKKKSWKYIRKLSLASMLSTAMSHAFALCKHNGWVRFSIPELWLCSIHWLGMCRHVPKHNVLPNKAIIWVYIVFSTSASLNGWECHGPLWICFFFIHDSCI